MLITTYHRHHLKSEKPWSTITTSMTILPLIITKCKSILLLCLKYLKSSLCLTCKKNKKQKTSFPVIQAFVYSATIYWEPTVRQALCYTPVYVLNIASDVIKFTIQLRQLLHKYFIFSMNALLYLSNLIHSPLPLLPHGYNYSDLHTGPRKTSHTSWPLSMMFLLIGTPSLL